jgi:hypothetical protein
MRERERQRERERETERDTERETIKKNVADPGNWRIEKKVFSIATLAENATFPVS